MKAVLLEVTEYTTAARGADVTPAHIPVACGRMCRGQSAA